MIGRKLLGIAAGADPENLLKMLVRVALISTVVVVCLSGYGFYRVFSGFVIKSAEVDSVHLCQILIDDQKEFLFFAPPGRPVELGLRSTEILPFDNRLRNFLAPFHIIKVKIYNTGRQIIYSTDQTLIGKVDMNNLRLQHALAGAVDAKMVTKDRARDLADEPLLDVDVVETYVPIISPDKRVVGSFEIYMNMTGYREQIRRGVAVTIVFMVLVLGGAFAVSYLMIRKSVSQLRAAQEQLEVAAVTDVLTGLYNRGYLLKRGEEEFERGRRSARPLGCIMLDLDFFKQVNDSRGHFAGDCVLKGVAESLAALVRTYDIAGRYGGEEFLILLPDTAFEEIIAVAERICTAVRESSYAADGTEVRITVSLGVACSGASDRSLSDVIKRADEGLYKAKADGRNRVSWIYQPGAGDMPA